MYHLHIRGDLQFSMIVLQEQIHTLPSVHNNGSASRIVCLTKTISDEKIFDLISQGDKSSLYSFTMPLKILILLLCMLHRAKDNGIKSEGQLTLEASFDYMKNKEMAIQKHVLVTYYQHIRRGKKSINNQYQVIVICSSNITYCI